MRSAAGIVHYTWPGGLAVVLEGDGVATAAVFDSHGWRVGPREAVLTAGPPSGATVARLALPPDVVARCAELEFVGGALHTDFVSLATLGRRLQADGASAALFVVGPHPAALVIADGTLTAFDPTHPGASEDDVLKRATGWIVHLAGRMRSSVPTSPDDATPASASAAAQDDGAPPAVAQDAPQPAGGADVAPPADPARAVPPAAAPAPWGPAFGRFPATACFLLAPGARAALPQAVDAELAAAVGAVRAQLLTLLDGAHTLAEIAATTGLGPAQVARAVEVLVAHRLAFRYVSRARTGSASR